MPDDTPLILVADDDAIGLEVLEAMLVDEGYRIAVAHDGGEAVARAREVVPDLVLLDVMMPVMDGFEVVRRLRADAVLAPIPVILVTALHDRDSRLRGIEAGADDFITKPIDRVELRARVRTVTRLDRFRHLLSERAKFEWVVESADDGYLVLDAAGSVRYANPRARDLLGLGTGAPSTDAEPFLALCRRHYRCEPGEAWRSWPAAGEGDSRRYLVRPESPLAAAAWLEAEAFPLPARTGPGCLVRLRDVTERLHALREVWAFHAAVNHKLRTPLAAMLPSLELLATRKDDVDAAWVARLASAAYRGANRLNDQIQDILAYVDVSRRPFVGEPFRFSDLPRLVTAIAADLGLATPALGGVESAADARCALAEPAVEMILSELLENAQKFHPARAPRVEVRVSREGDAVGLEVRDDGQSLPPAELAKVLTPYYQAEKSPTGQLPGMGLGLPTVATLLWGVGGACRLRNREDGPGLVVELQLPLSRRPVLNGNEDV